MKKRLIKALQEKVMPLSEMITELKIAYSIESAELVSGLLSEIKEEHNLIEKVPGQYYIGRKE